jgi:hypothetical protein
MLEKIDAFVQMAKEHRLGFKIDEIMSGTHQFVPGCGPAGRWPLEFAVTWGPHHVTTWLDPRSDHFGLHDLQGTVTVGGLCKDAPCQGTLELSYLSDHKITYAFDFDVDGTSYHYVGEKVNIQLWNLPVAHTTCYGTLTEQVSGRLISRSVTHFRMRTLPGFVLSFRLA